MSLAHQVRLMAAALVLTAGMALVPLGLSHLHRAMARYAFNAPVATTVQMQVP